MKIDGKELRVQPSSFKNAMALKRAISKALRRDGINFDLKDISINDDDILKSNLGGQTLGSLIENILAVVTDEGIEESLFNCCETVVLFNNDLVNVEFFEKVENRKYYYPIMVEVLKVNLSPFFEKISSMFTGVGELMQKFQKSK